MSPRRRAVLLAPLAALALVACVEADNGNNTLAVQDGEQTPSAAEPTAPGAPQSTAPARPGQGGNAGGAIDLEANDNDFVPATIDAKAGDITIEMRNTGKAPHTFTNADLKVDVNANAGETATIKLTGVKPGTYKIICKYHETIGMVGELKVS